MRKYLITLLIIIFTVLLFLAVKNGYQIGNLKALSLGQVKQSKEELDTKIEAITTLTTSTYESKISNLTSETKNLLLKKADYNDLVTFSSDDEIKAANVSQKYKIEYLWTKIGNHATKNGVTIKMDVVNGTNGLDGSYDLNFSVSGKYISISDFVYDLEDDDTLGFKIENFSLTPDSNDDLAATFTAKNISIELDKSSLVSSGTGTGATGSTSSKTSNTASTNTAATNTAKK